MDAPLRMACGYGVQIVFKQVNRGPEWIASIFPTYRLSQGDQKLHYMLCDGHYLQGG